MAGFLIMAILVHFPFFVSCTKRNLATLVSMAFEAISRGRRQQEVFSSAWHIFFDKNSFIAIISHMNFSSGRRCSFVCTTRSFCLPSGQGDQMRL
jgi:hypothetical protein